MAPNFPFGFVDEIRMQIIDSDSYQDEEIWTFARVSILRINQLIRGSISIVNGTSVYDYTVSGTEVDSTDYWEVIKWATITDLLNHYMKKMIAEGIGASVGLGSERIDTKTIILTVKDLVKESKATLKQKILAYNMLNIDGVSIDLYTVDRVW